MTLTLDMIIAAVIQGGWGVAGLFAYFFWDERRAARVRDAEVFKLLSQQLPLLGERKDRA